MDTIAIPKMSNHAILFSQKLRLTVTIQKLTKYATSFKQMLKPNPCSWAWNQMFNQSHANPVNLARKIINSSRIKYKNFKKKASSKSASHPGEHKLSLQKMRQGNIKRECVLTFLKPLTCTRKLMPIPFHELILWLIPWQIINIIQPLTWKVPTIKYKLRNQIGHTQHLKRMENCTNSIGSHLVSQMELLYFREWWTTLLLRKVSQTLLYT